MKNFATAFFLLISLAIAASVTMAANSNETPAAPSSPQAMPLTLPTHSKFPAMQRGEKIYFYSFDGTYLRTSAGTFPMLRAKVVNHGNEDLRKVNGVGQKMEVKLTVINRQVTQADVYPDSEQ